MEILAISAYLRLNLVYLTSHSSHRWYLVALMMNLVPCVTMCSQRPCQDEGILNWRLAKYFTSWWSLSRNCKFGEFLFQIMLQQIHLVLYQTRQLPSHSQHKYDLQWHVSSQLVSGFSATLSSSCLTSLQLSPRSSFLLLSAGRLFLHKEQLLTSIVTVWHRSCSAQQNVYTWLLLIPLICLHCGTHTT